MKKPRVLVADDEEGIREALRLILSPEYEVTIVDNGADTYKQLTKTRFALALLDIKMPKMDGLEILRRIKAPTFRTPILMLTAYQSVELAKEAVKLGAVDYVPKPFERDHVLKAVHSILDKHSMSGR